MIPPVEIPYFNAATRRMDEVEIAPLPIAYASFYASQIATGRFGATDRLAEAAALLAGLLAGGGLVLTRRAPDTTRNALARLRRRSPVLRWRLRRAVRARDLLAIRALLAETHPEAREAAAEVERALYGRDPAFDPAAFRRALRRAPPP